MSKFRYQLTHGEPILNLLVQPTAAFLGALGAKAANLVYPIAVPCIIDTGFNGFLALDQPVAKKWKLKTRNFNKVDVLQGGNENWFDSYAWEADVAIKFQKTSQTGQSILIDPVPATLVEFFDNIETRAMLGQQFLQIVTFVYNGPAQAFSLGFSRRLLQDASVQVVS